MRKIERMLAVFVVAFVFAAAFVISPRDMKPVWAQGFPFSVNFPGVQAGNTTDFGTPPISFTPFSGQTSTAQMGNQTVPIGSVAYTSFGNATTNVAAEVFFASIWVPGDETVTNINILNGGTVGTDKGIVSLYNSAGTLLASSAIAGIATAGANTFQAYPLTLSAAGVAITNIAIQGPGRYWIGYQPNGTTDNFRTVAASTFVNVRSTGVTGGTFGTLPNLTTPGTFTANVGPIAYLN
jgi:hypothetical protein